MFLIKRERERFEHLVQTGVSFYREPQRAWFVSRQGCRGAGVGRGLPYRGKNMTRG